MASNGLELPISAEQAIAIARQQVAAGRFSQAADLCRRVLRDQPDRGDALHLLSVATRTLPERAFSCFEQGNAFREREEIDDAIAAYRRAIAMRPGFAEAYSNLGNALASGGQIDAAIAAYEEAIRLKPDLVDAHWNLALALLALGDFERGWAEYEWRHRRGSSAACPGTEWKGENIAGKTILLIAEQGLGDAVQFIRYVPMVAATGARIVLVCQPELRRVFRDVRDLSAIIAFREPLPGFDVYCHLMSLPGIFRTGLESIPKEIPYLKAEAALVDKWAKIVGQRAGRLRVGLAWAGRAEHQYDRARSMCLDDFSPLCAAPKIEFHSLQIGPASQQAQTPPAGMNLIDHGPMLTDLAETAALIANLDLVISVDTLVPHLAGALGRAVWAMLPFSADWRWLLERSDSPWYPTMRLFRQQSRGDWAGVVQNVRKQLSLGITRA